jgi:hypothetical protein
MTIDIKKINDMTALAEAAYANVLINGFKGMKYKGVSGAQVARLEKSYLIVQQQFS